MAEVETELAMRILILILALLPAASFAEEIALSSEVTAVTLYPSGATVTREAPFSAPAGDHQLIVTDLPRSTPMEAVRVTAQNVIIGNITTRTDFVPPRSPKTDAAIAAAKAEIERLEGALRKGQAHVDHIRLEAKAARARVDFLASLSRGDNLAAMETDNLQALVTLVGQETLNALKQASDATRRADAAARDLKTLKRDLERARQALAALVPEEKKRAMLPVSIRADAPKEGLLRVSYMINDAIWRPVYDLRLERGNARLQILRGALIRQQTGENWTDVALKLSTVRPNEQASPTEVWPLLRRILDPDALRPEPLARAKGAAELRGAVPLEEPMAVVQADAQFEGLSVSYAYPDPVSVASGADMVRLALGTLETKAAIVARAAPLHDDSAYLMASFTNDSGEPILPTEEARFYLDGGFVGRRAIGAVPAGGAEEFSFGPIDGLRLRRTVLRREEGARGMITRSSEITEQVRIEVENLTSETWPLRVIDRVPYSEQENLKITWTAKPPVSEQNVDDKRGVLAWEFDLPAGKTRTIELRQRLQWPEGMVLR